MSQSVIEAIKDGVWDYEPQGTDDHDYHSTRALPGSAEKLDVLADRLLAGLPLWHPADRHSYDDHDGESLRA